MIMTSTKTLKFLLSILTGKERKWLLHSNCEDVLQFNRLAFMLQGFPGDKKIENMMSWCLLDIISHKKAYKELT
jgi:hypothetical protein